MNWGSAAEFFAMGVFRLRATTIGSTSMMSAVTPKEPQT